VKLRNAKGRCVFGGNKRMIIKQRTRNVGGLAPIARETTNSSAAGVEVTFFRGGTVENSSNPGQKTQSTPKHVLFNEEHILRKKNRGEGLSLFVEGNKQIQERVHNLSLMRENLGKEIKIQGKRGEGRIAEKKFQSALVRKSSMEKKKGAGG